MDLQLSYFRFLKRNCNVCLFKLFYKLEMEIIFLVYYEVSIIVVLKL